MAFCVFHCRSNSFQVSQISTVESWGSLFLSRVLSSYGCGYTPIQRDENPVTKPPHQESPDCQVLELYVCSVVCKGLVAVLLSGKSGR
jgi:hypothetical protein